MSIRSITQSVAAGSGVLFSGISAFLLFSGNSAKSGKGTLGTVQCIAGLVSIAASAFLMTQANPGNVKDRVAKARARGLDDPTVVTVSEDPAGSGMESSQTLPLMSVVHIQTGTPLKKKTSNRWTFFGVAGIGTFSSLTVLGCTLMIPPARPLVIVFSSSSALGNATAAYAKWRGDKEIEQAEMEMIAKIEAYKQTLAPSNLRNNQHEVELELQRWELPDNLEELVLMFDRMKALVQGNRIHSPQKIKTERLLPTTITPKHFSFTETGSPTS